MDKMSKDVKRFLLFIIIYLIVMLVATSCGSGIKEGTIVNKYYEPKRKWVDINYDTHRDDEDYVLIVTGVNKDGDYTRERVEVSKCTYHKHEVGDYIKLKL